MAAYLQVDILEQKNSFFNSVRDKESTLEIHTPEHDAQINAENWPINSGKKVLIRTSPL